MFRNPVSAMSVAPCMYGSRRDISWSELAISVFVHARDGIAIVDHRALVIEVNDAFCASSGYGRDEILGQDLFGFQSLARVAEFRGALWREVQERGVWRGEVVSRRKDGRLASELLTLGEVRKSDGQLLFYVGTFSDIAPLIEDRRRLKRLGHFDALTGLPNRHLLMDRMGQMLAWAGRAGGQVTVCHLDLDGFKEINDSRGAHVGDWVLTEIGRRLSGELRSGDTVARLCGDAFGLLIAQTNGSDDVGIVLRRLLDCIARPIGDDPAVTVSASIGVTSFPIDQGDADTLLRHAEQAMCRAREAGRGLYRMFDSGDGGGTGRLRVRPSLLGEASAALENEGFCLHFQPKIDLKARRVAGFEALLRWQHPTRGLILPDDFLVLFKNPGMAARIDLQVLHDALKQMALWLEAGRRVSVSVNISAHLLRQPGFQRTIGFLLDKFPTVSPGDLQLEILETTLLDDLPRLGRQIKACRALGVGIAIDDFGTGYSCLTWLKWIPAHVLKIDRSFVAGMVDFPDDRAIVNTVLGLGRDFQRQIVAEGAETAAHVRLLGHLGCDLAQGFGIARPMPAAEVMAWMDGFAFDRAWLPVPGEYPPVAAPCNPESCTVWKIGAGALGERVLEPGG